MNAKAQHTMLKEMGVKTFYIGKLLDDPKRATAIFKDQKMFYRIFLWILKQNL